jgi:hypothetical protein
MAQTYRFRTDLRCHLVTGEIEVLRSYRVAVYANTRQEALASIQDIAFEKVGDEGGDLLDAPLERLEVISIEDA